MTQITDRIWTMDVPSMAFGFMVNNYANESELIYMLSMSDIADDDSSEETLITKPLPPGTWRFLFTTKTATEEDARKVVGNPQYDSFGCYEVYSPYGVTDDPYETANDALDGLLRSKNLDEKNNYALIEKENERL